MPKTVIILPFAGRECQWAFIYACCLKPKA
jgi:hypothetical protein